MRVSKRVCAAGAVALWAGIASAQFSADFEAPAYSGSASGVVLTGQQGWYLPVVGSSDYSVYTYAGNALGFAQNPTGGDQFAAGRWPGAAAFARAQVAVAFTDGKTYTAAWDIAFVYDGPTPAVDNVGSFSLQPSATARFWQTLYRWVDINDPDAGVKAEYNVFTAAGGALNNQIAGPEWAVLKLNNWYRQTTTWDFATNTVTEVTITDLSTGAKATFQPTTWHLAFGTNFPGTPLPTDVRFFTGGSGTTNEGNTVGWDNLDVLEEAPGCYPDCDENGQLNIDDFICFQLQFALQNSYADCDGNGIFNIDDFICFQLAFALGC